MQEQALDKDTKMLGLALAAEVPAIKSCTAASICAASASRRKAAGGVGAGARF
jgi:hypothetical protein